MPLQLLLYRPIPVLAIHEITSDPQISGKIWYSDILHPVEMEPTVEQFAAYCSSLEGEPE